jgi:Tripartite tricarboxylate transporter TctA family
VWGLLASLLIGNAILLVLNLPLAPVWAKLLHIPRPYLYAGILFFASLGAYTVNGSAVDLIVLFAMGLLGFLMRRYGIPVVPAIIGVILGPRAEVQLRRALQISDGDISGLFNTPFSVTVYAIIAMLVLWPLIDRFIVRRLRRPRHELHAGHSHALIELAEELVEEERAREPEPAVPGRHGGNNPAAEPTGAPPRPATPPDPIEPTEADRGSDTSREIP